MSTHDLPYPELQYAWDYKPLPLSTHPLFEPPEVVAPISFYDKHLDERLKLKKVILWPTLLTDLSTAVDRATQSLKDKSIILPPLSESDDIPECDWSRRRHAGYRRYITRVESIADFYQSTTAPFCKAIASTLLLSPRAPEWQSLLIWRWTSELMLDGYKSAEEGYGLVHDNNPTPSEWDSVEEVARPVLRYAREKSPTLAHWQIFASCRESKKLLRDLGNVAEEPHFLHDQSSTVGFPSYNAVLPYTPDAITTPWGAPTSSFGDKRRDATPPPQFLSRPPMSPEQSQGRSPTELDDENVNSKSESDSEASGVITSGGNTCWPNITLPGERKEPRSIAHLVIQRAWTRSVRMDSTFMVFNCGGEYERIGFRHRESQTLFLSDLIDVSHGEDPAYGKLHAGLYTSILRDVLDRTAQKMKQEPETLPDETKKRKRESEEPLGIEAKRPKTRGQASRAKTAHKERRELQKLVGAEVASRRIALIQMRFESYNSSAPNAFIRSGHPRPENNATYTPDQYISLIVASKIAAGATGIVHNAKLEYVLEDRKTVRSLDVAIKFAFGSEQREKMSHEYSVYKHLGEIEGIPMIIGLFEDLENDTLALVMTHVGIALVTIYSRQLKLIVPEPQNTAFVNLMKRIHRYGVRHRDLRPENLTIDDNGQVYVIDFDMAELGPTYAAKKREIVHLQELLNGSYYPPHEFPSDRTRDSESSYASSTESEC